MIYRVISIHQQVVANTISGQNVQLESQLYYWNKQDGKTKGEFVFYQPFQVNSCYCLQLQSIILGKDVFRSKLIVLKIKGARDFQWSVSLTKYN